MWKNRDKTCLPERASAFIAIPGIQVAQAGSVFMESQHQRL
jgi:hypothetical protein